MLLFLLEKYGPAVGGIILLVVNFAWMGLLIPGTEEWGNRLLDRVIQASAVGVAFWGVAITLLMGMDTKPVIAHLKRLGQYRMVVHYFEESLFGSLSLLLVTTLLEPLGKKVSQLAISSVWLGVGAWALLATARTYAVLGSLLAHSSEN